MQLIVQKHWIFHAFDWKEKKEKKQSYLCMMEIVVSGRRSLSGRMRVKIASQIGISTVRIVKRLYRWWIMPVLTTVIVYDG